MNTGNGQLELGIEPARDDTESPAIELPRFQITAQSTPGEIVAWWEDLVGIFTAERVAVRERVKPLEAEMATCGRSDDDRRRKRRLTRKRDEMLAVVEGLEFQAHAMFEIALGDFNPTLIELMQAEGLDIPDDDELATAQFWDCLQGPWIEVVGDRPLTELVREFYG